MNKRILSIDPSGTGTSGIYYRNGERELFKQFTSREWKEHLNWIMEQTQALKPSLVLYEHTNFISLRGKDMTSLLKLLGVIEVFPFLQTIAIPVDQVKRLRAKLLKGEQKIEGLEYKPGKGWHHNQKKISAHCLDAYLVYWLWENKQKSKPIGKTITNLKTKQKTSKNRPPIILLDEFEKKNHKENIIEPEPEDFEDDFNCEPGCENCGQLDCICEPEELEDETIYCPEPKEEPEDIDENPDDRDIDEEIEND